MKKSKALGYLAAFAGIAFILNWLSVRFTGYPFLYCWGEPLVGPLYQIWGQPLSFLLAMVFVILLFMGKHKQAFIMAMAYGFVVILPQWAYTLASLGSTCNA